MMADHCTTEQIGSVLLDVSRWPGSELYTDGPIEKELLELYKDNPDMDPVTLLMDDDRYALLYHLSRERENILSWYPFTRDMRVLEVGAGCGAITGLLAKRCAHVSAVDISLTRSRINAWRHRDADNLTIYVRNLFDIPAGDQYDVITLIGVLEYSNLFTDSDDAFDDVIILLRSLLKPSGHLLIAIENRMGLKYLSGAREEHLWQLYAGVEGYPPKTPRTLTRSELSSLLTTNGFAYHDFYFPFPDYKFARQIFSDSGKSFYKHLNNDFPNFGEYAYEGANQASVFQSLRKDSLFTELSNSFFIDAYNEGAASADVKYVQVASLRNNDTAIQTVFREYADGIKVRKVPLTGAAEAHIVQITENAKKLSSSSSVMRVIDIAQEENAVVSQYTTYNSLSEELEKPDTRPLLLKRYHEMLLSLSDLQLCEFSKQHAFQEVFGLLEAPPMICALPAPIDMVFGNLLINSNGEFVVIDTEWVFDMPIPIGYICWRAAYLLEESHGISKDIILDALNVNCNFLPLFQQMEGAFRDYVFSKRSPRQFNQRYQSRKFSMSDAFSTKNGPYASVLLTIHDDRIINEQTMLFDHDRDIIEQHFKLEDNMNGKQLRYTPLRGRMCKIVPIAIEYDAVPIDPAKLRTNAVVYTQEDGWFFETFDPCVFLPPVPNGARTLKIRVKHTLYYDPDIERILNDYRMRVSEGDFFKQAYHRTSLELASVYNKQDALYEDCARKDSEIACLYAQRDSLHSNISEKDAELMSLYAQRDVITENLSEKEMEIEAVHAQREALQENLSAKENELEAVYTLQDALNRNLTVKEEKLVTVYAQREVLQENLSAKEAELESVYMQRVALYENLSTKETELEAVYAQREALYENLTAKENEIADICNERTELSVQVESMMLNETRLSEEIDTMRLTIEELQKKRLRWIYS